MNKVQKRQLLLVFIAYVGACIETDLFLPSLSDMMNFFSVDGSKIQKVISVNFLGICISSFFIGSISDSIGRKTSLLLTLGVFFFGSLITAFTDQYFSFIIGRWIQGLGAGGVFALGTAIITDLFSGMEAVKARNWINSFMPVLTAGSPLLGGFIDRYFGFRGNFVVIACIVSVSLLSVLFLFEETLPVQNRKPLKLRRMILDYVEVTSNSRFWALTCIMSLLAAGYLVFIAQIAVLFLTEFQVNSNVFPWYQGSILVTFLIGNLSGHSLIQRLSIPTIKKIGIALILLSMVFLTGFTQRKPHPTMIVLSILPYVLGFSWIQMLYFSELLDLCPKTRGTVSSVRSSARLLITALIVEIAAGTYNSTIHPIVWIELGIVSLVVTLAFFYEKNQMK